MRIVDLRKQMVRPAVVEKGEGNDINTQLRKERESKEHQIERFFMVIHTAVNANNDTGLGGQKSLWSALF